MGSAAFGEQRARWCPGFLDVYRLRPGDRQCHCRGGVHSDSQRKPCPTQKGLATPRVKPMHALASIYPLAWHTVISRGPFGAQNPQEARFKDLGHRRRLSRTWWLLTTFLMPCGSKGILQNVPKYNSRELPEVLGEDGEGEEGSK